VPTAEGRYIAYTHYEEGNAEIYILGVDFNYPMRLTVNPAQDKAATWSADGRQLVFVSNREGNYELYLMNADGSGQTRQTDNTADDNWPLWAH
jgi:Tol biopolymer transport system component